MGEKKLKHCCRESSSDYSVNKVEFKRYKTTRTETENCEHGQARNYRLVLVLSLTHKANHKWYSTITWTINRQTNQTRQGADEYHWDTVTLVKCMLGNVICNTEVRRNKRKQEQIQKDHDTHIALLAVSMFQQYKLFTFGPEMLFIYYYLLSWTTISLIELCLS